MTIGVLILLLIGISVAVSLIGGYFIWRLDGKYFLVSCLIAFAGWLVIIGIISIVWMLTTLIVNLWNTPL